jgi:hypothetical protein
MTPRWLDAPAAAAHLSYPSVQAFLDAVKRDVLPAPCRRLGPRSPRWDRDALDALMTTSATSENTRAIVDAAIQEIQNEGRKGRAAQIERRHG